MGRWENKYVIGLTGNIATGKSLVRRMLEHLGAYTLDADGLAHQAMAPGAPAYKPVITMFGQWILDSEQRIDRAKLGAVVFAHPEALAHLEAITHPIIGQAIDTLLQRARHKVVVVEAIKLLESQLVDQVDTIWVVDASEQQQLERLAKRGLAQADALKRIRMQNPQADKIARAQVVINNNGTPEETWAQVRAAWSKIKGAAEDEAAQAVVQRVEVRPQPAPAAPSAAAPAAVPTATQAAPTAPAAPAGMMTITALDIVRGMPKNADMIRLIERECAGREMSQQDVLMAFGQKSYLLAVVDSRPVGLVGFLVDNLITRVDELLIIKQAPIAPVTTALVEAVERASRELQSEVGYIFLPPVGSEEAAKTLKQLGYEYHPALDQITVPAWREAVRESAPEGSRVFGKKLRAERVLKPL